MPNDETMTDESRLPAQVDVRSSQDVLEAVLSHAFLECGVSVPEEEWCHLCERTGVHLRRLGVIPTGRLP